MQQSAYVTLQLSAHSSSREHAEMGGTRMQVQHLTQPHGLLILQLITGTCGAIHGSPVTWCLREAEWARGKERKD